MMLFLLQSINIDAMYDAIADLFTALLVTIPTQFINAGLSSGFLYDIWIAFFGNADVITLFLILGFFGGVYLLVTSNFKSGTLNARGGDLF